jgi:hypothetical protein
MLSVVLVGWSGGSLWCVDVDGERCEGKVVSGSTSVLQLGDPILLVAQLT